MAGLYCTDFESHRLDAGPFTCRLIFPDLTRLTLRLLRQLLCHEDVLAAFFFFDGFEAPATDGGTGVAGAAGETAAFSFT
jgi:hypothetical protein